MTVIPPFDENLMVDGYDPEVLAAGSDCWVFYPDEGTLTLDLDSDTELQFFHQQLEAVLRDETLSRECEVHTFRSRRNWHAVIYLPMVMDLKDRILFQLLLGSDQKRERMNLHRWELHIPQPIRLFIPNGSQVPPRKNPLITDLSVTLDEDLW